MKKIIMNVLAFIYFPSVLALEPLAEDELKNILGQGGVYLTGDITINETGGPLNNTADSSNPAIWQQNCTAVSTDKRCGARIAVNAGDGANSGWLVLDNIRGRFSFEGMTLKTRTITSGFDDAGSGASDGAAFNGDVLEIGLPNTIKYTNVSYTLANSSEARPTDVGFNQTDIFNVKIDGDISLQGNLLLFPTGKP